jgi:hypothetical protein
MIRRLPLVFLLLLGAMSGAPAGTTGKIAGTVKDSQSGEELIGASIVLEGTATGAATNIDGYYVILNVQPGTYTLTATAVGYAKKTINTVRVSIDLTTTIDIQLNQTVLDVGEEVVITAERPVIRRDLTAKTAVVGAEQIASLPVTEVSGVLNLQAGFVSGSLRGGRKGEVAYWVDGVPVTDVYDGSQVVEVNKNLVQELQLVSGAFNAEYGQAMSGIVNIATKEGSSKFTGGLGFYGGDYVSTDSEIFPGIQDRSPFAIRNFEGNLSGPIVSDVLTFFANGRYIYFGGWRKGVRRFNPWNIVQYDSAGQNVTGRYRDPELGQGNGKIVPMNWSRRTYAQGKLTWHVTPVIKASLNYIYDNNPYKDFSNDYFYNPDGMRTNYNLSNTFIFQLSHTLGGSTFYTLGGSWFDKDFKAYTYEDPHDPRYTHPQLFTRPSYSMFAGGTDLSRFHRSTKTLLGKLDLTSQLNAVNLVKVGVEARRHKVFYEDYNLIPVLSQQAFDPLFGSPFIDTEIPPISADISVQRGTYTHKPIELAAYFQDKMEFKDFILNIGIRFDYFQPDGVVLADESDPNIYNPIKPENIAKSMAERRASWYKKASSKSQFSPRIGASFPITDRGVVHFSYGHFFQVPRFERLYENPDFRLGTGTGNEGVIGNADLKPEQTINGEIGIQQQITEDVSVDLTAYLRDIRNLTTTGADQIEVFGGSARYSKYQNRDFGTIKGIVVTVTKRFSSGFNATLDYTYQVARGSGSDPQQARTALLGGTLPEIQLTPLNWDQRHTLNITASYAAPTWGGSLIGQYGSGTPYTPRRSADITALLNNAQTKPGFVNLDAQAFYQIPISPFNLVAFLRVFNVLDTRNETDVFDDTGRAGFTTDYQQAVKANPSQIINTLDEWFRRTTNYSEPRRIEFGVNLEF